MSEQQWIDKFAIQELIYSHSDAISRGDLGALEPLYAPHAIWEMPLLGLRFESARAFFDWLAENTAPHDLLVQTAQNPVVRLVDELTATATTTIFEMARGILVVALDGPLGGEGDEVNVAQYAVIYDDVSKSTGRWLFTHRLIVPCYMKQGGVDGDVLATRSSLFAP